MRSVSVSSDGDGEEKEREEDDDDVDEDENEDDDEDDDDDDDDDDYGYVPDPYQERAASEFADTGSDDGGGGGGGALAYDDDNKDGDDKDGDGVGGGVVGGVGSTTLDWGGAYGSLSERITDVESGRTGPSYALFRTMTSETPNRSIGRFVEEADPTVVAAMTGAVGSLLGGLSNPSRGVETSVKATKEKLGNLCFQLQMTG